MRAIYLIVLLSIICLPFVAVGQTADVTQGCFPLSVEFTPPAGAGSSFWNFDDGATSTLAAPSHTFIVAGTFEVEYSATAGGPVIGTVTIEVYAPPSPEFTSTAPEGCAPLSVTFTENVTLPPGLTVSGYSWVYGDGGNSTGASDTHVFSSPGSYSVSLGITTNLPSCNVTELVPDYVTVTTSPSVSFTTNPNPPIGCEPPVTISFNNTSSTAPPLTFEWDFGNGQTSIASSPPAQTYTAAGTYPVVLTGTDASGCASTSQLTVGVGQPVASFSVPDTFCLGQSIQMTNLSPSGSYSWSFGPNALPQNSIGIDPIVTYFNPGLQDITLTINGDCPDDTTITVFVEEVTAEFISNPDFSCQSPMEVQFTPLQGGLNYVWTFADGMTSTDQSPTYTYFVGDTTTYSINGAKFPVNHFLTTLAVTSNAGCTAQFSARDTIHEPNALSHPDVVQGCDPVTVTFTDASGSIEPIVEWEYFFGDGTSVSFADGAPQVHVYNGVGEYEFFSIVTNAAGCKDTSFVQIIEVGDVLPITFESERQILCIGETVEFINTTDEVVAANVDAWHYTSDNSTMFHCFQEDGLVWGYGQGLGPQDVSLTAEYNGCYTTETLTDYIEVLGPLAKANFSCECETPFTIEFENQSEGFTDILWDFGDGNTSSESDPVHTYDATGDYQVVLQAINGGFGCPDHFDTLTVHIRDIGVGLDLPEVACQGIVVELDGSMAQDVHAECYKGYTFSFSDSTMRPITTADPQVQLAFQNTGTIEVTLTVTDINGCQADVAANTQIYGIDADFDISSALPSEAICFPTVVSFDDLTVADTTVVDWSWTFGDGSTGSGPDIDHLYTGAGSILPPVDEINVTLVVTDTIGCQSSQQYTIDYYVPTSQVSLSDATICAGDSIFFEATDFTSRGSALDFDWVFGNGESSSEQNPIVPYLEGGNYEVQLVYTEQSSGCVDSTLINVQVADYPVAGFFSASDDAAVICPNENVLFTDTSIFNGPQTPVYAWDFGNGSTSVFADPGTFFSANGDYTVELIVTIPAPFGCRDTVSQEYTVYGPIGSFTTDIGTQTICRLDEVLFTIDAATEADTFFWDFGDGVTSAGVSPITHVYDFVPPSGQTFASMVMSNADGSCPLVHDEPINIYEVIADFERNDNDVDTAICFQAYPLLNLSQGSDLAFWDFGDGTFSNSTTVSSHQYPAPGTYGITLAVSSSEFGCTDTLYKEVVLFPLPTVAALGDTICEGEVGSIDVISPVSIWDYTWTTNAPASISNANSPQATSSPPNTAVYNVLVTDTNSCTANDAVTIIVFNPPDIQDFEETVPQGDTVILPLALDTALYDFVWTPDDVEGSCLDCTPPSVQAVVDQLYTVVITDRRGCFTTVVDYLVKVFPDTYVAMPTTFTPNGDGVNDIIYAEGWGIKELLEYQIFNRWGEVVFETDDIDVGWDGYYKGALQNNDVYVYKIRAINWLDEPRTLEGHINLMR